jgi:acetoin utilization protein AcuB
LSIWELNYLLSKLLVKEVMTKEVITVTEDTPIEEAARIMADNKIGGLPVMSGGAVSGIITETDLFKMLLELMGAREQGVRVTAVLEDKPGELAKLATAISKEGANIVAMGEFAGEDTSTREIVLKVSGIDQEKVKEVVKSNVKELRDIRS